MKRKDDWIVPVLIIVASFAVVVLLGPCARRAGASPLYVTLDSGFTAFKWGYETTEGAGFPHLERPRWDIEPGVEWTPWFLERYGVWLRASFRWQALGDWPRTHSGEFYVDGPRLGLRFRGRVTP